MKNILNAFFIFFFSLFSLESLASSDSLTISLEEITQKISTENYLVLENAQRVYQAKEAIEVSRGNLLPHLNFWKVAAITFEPMAAIGMVEDIAPFLVPANWFRVKEQEILYLATQESYRALWANELMTGRNLYFKILFDEILLEKIQENKNLINQILNISKMREKLGGQRQTISQDIEVRVLALQEDIRSLEVLINEELNSLSYLMGHASEVEIKPQPIDLPEFENFEPLNYTDFEFRVLDTAPELRQMEYLVKVADLVKKEEEFSFLGGSNLSRGVAGGVFDGLPMGVGGLGFGLAPAIRVAKAQKEILKIQKRGIEEVLKRQLKNLVNNYNLDLENHVNLKRRSELTKNILDNLFRRLTLGEEIEVLDLVEASRNYIQASSSFFAINYRFLANEDKLSRLIFHGDYDKKPAGLEEVEKRSKE